MNFKKEFKVLIMGRAGEGVQWLGKKVADDFLIKNPKKFVSLLSEYQSGVRTGKSQAQLIFSDKEITCPFIDKADILVDLSERTIGHLGEKEKLIGNSRLNEQALKKLTSLLNS